MKMNRKEMLNRAAVIIFLFLICSFVLMCLSSHQPKWISRQLEPGELFFFEKNEEYWSGLTDYCVEGDTLYILFDHNSILKIYDTAGNYLRSYAFYSTNGESALYRKDQTVYLQDKNHNFFTFHAGELREKILYSNYSSFLKTKDGVLSDREKRTGADGIYVMKGASLACEKADGDIKTVVARPFPLVYFQGMTPWIVQMLLLLVFAILVLAGRKTKNVKEDKALKKEN